MEKSDLDRASELFWCGTVAGTYAGHGDYFTTVAEDTWTSFGGKLSGGSTPRLAFLRKILKDSPATGIDPIGLPGPAGRLPAVHDRECESAKSDRFRLPSRDAFSRGFAVVYPGTSCSLTLR